MVVSHINTNSAMSCNHAMTVIALFVCAMECSRWRRSNRPSIGPRGLTTVKHPLSLPRQHGHTLRSGSLCWLVTQRWSQAISFKRVRELLGLASLLQHSILCLDFALLHYCHYFYVPIPFPFFKSW